MNEMLNKQWPITIKGNIFVNCVSALFGILFLAIGTSSTWFGITCIGGPSAWIAVPIFLLIGIIFLRLAYRFIAEIINTTTHFKIAADENGLCLLMGDKYIPVPNEYITSIWVGQPDPFRIYGRNATYLVITFKKDFSPYNNPISNYFFQLKGHRIRYRQAELGISLLEAQGLLKSYWKAEQISN